MTNDDCHFTFIQINFSELLLCVCDWKRSPWIKRSNTNSSVLLRYNKIAIYALLSVCDFASSMMYVSLLLNFTKLSLTKIQVLYLITCIYNLNIINDSNFSELEPAISLEPLYYKADSNRHQVDFFIIIKVLNIKDKIKLPKYFSSIVVFYIELVVVMRFSTTSNGVSLQKKRVKNFLFFSIASGEVILRYTEFSIFSELKSTFYSCQDTLYIPYFLTNF